MKLFRYALALFCLTAPGLHAQLDGTDPQYRALCRAALARPFTPPPADPAFKPDCDSSTYYFGIGRPIDYPAARACALVEYTSATTPSIFSGAGILSMIYANGQGTPVDLDLATRFTCESDAAPAEIEGRLDILQHDRDTHTLAKFDLCETATSGNAQGWCESIDARLSDADRNPKITHLEATLPPAAIEPFHNLQKAEDDFIQQRTANEIDLSGTARAAFVLEEQNDLRDQFLANLLAVTSPGFHEPTAFSIADKRLNEIYKPLLKAAEKSRLPRAPKTIPETTIAYKGIQETQRSWLQLRDAWMAFATADNTAPGNDKQAAALVTLQRTHELGDLIAATVDN